MKDRQKKTMVWDKYEKCANGKDHMDISLCCVRKQGSKRTCRSEFSAELGETREIGKEMKKTALRIRRATFYLGKATGADYYHLAQRLEKGVGAFIRGMGATNLYRS